MRTALLLALIAPVVVLGQAKSARAAGNGGGDLSEAFAEGSLITVEGGTVLAFGILDLDRHRGTAYGTLELTYNEGVGLITRDLALEGDGDDEDPSPALLTATAIHTALMVDGVAQIGESRRWHTSSTATVAGFAASAVWFAADGADDRDPSLAPRPARGAGYGAAEVAVNTPVLAGLTYVTISEARAGNYGRTALAVTGAIVTGGMIGDGIDHIAARAHHHMPRLAPTIVDGGANGTGGEDLGIGLGTHGRW